MAMVLIMVNPQELPVFEDGFYYAGHTQATKGLERRPNLTDALIHAAINDMKTVVEIRDDDIVGTWEFVDGGRWTQTNSLNGMLI